MSDNEQNRDKREEVWVHTFDEEAAHKFREHLIRQAREAPSPNHPLIVYIDSYGGSADSLAAMIETMDEIPNPVYTVCMGKAMSAGAFLLSHGDQRFCGQHSRIMIHECAGFVCGNVNDISNETKETQRINKHFLTLLAKNCKVRGGYGALRKIFRVHEGREIYMDAQAAKRFGIVDYIGVPVIEIALMYVTSTHKRQQ